MKDDFRGRQHGEEAYDYAAELALAMPDEDLVEELRHADLHTDHSIARSCALANEILIRLKRVKVGVGLFDPPDIVAAVAFAERTLCGPVGEVANRDMELANLMRAVIALGKPTTQNLAPEHVWHAPMFSGHSRIVRCSCGERTPETEQNSDTWFVHHVAVATATDEAKP